jgi:Holliday junction resolvase-like predicted endonuclease
MRLFVYGKNKDDKGTQLEVLTSAILKGMGYVVVRNEVKSGGNELDVVATKKEAIGGDINLICECKAHNNLITMNDWLKFIGKLHLEQRKNQMTHGLVIALSGANGNVLGSYKDIKTDNYITLITNEDIFGHILTIHTMATESQAADVVGRYTRKDILEINIIYYDNCYYWHICFPNGEYTILKDDFSDVEADMLAAFIEMIEAQTNSRLFLDIKEEYEAIQRRSLIRTLVLSYTLDEEHTLKEIEEWINSIKTDFNVTYEEVEESVKAIPYLGVGACGTVNVIDVSEIDFLEFYRFILTDTVSVKVMVTRFYKDHVNRELLDSIKQLQKNIQIPEENIEECLFLMKHSPSALNYTIYEDEAITRYRSKDKAIFPNIEKAHTEWFLDNVMRGFIADYNNGALSEYYLDEEKIASIELHTNLKIFKDGQEPREVHHYKAMCLGHLSNEYNNKAVLMVKIPE